MIVLVQEPWDASAVEATLGPLCALAATRRPTAAPSLLLLPLADPARSVDGVELLTGIGSLARTHDLFIGGAARVGSGAARRTLGFLVGPSGEPLLQAQKTLPDLVETFSDTASALGVPRDFPCVQTPFGKIAILVGEDILAPSLARMASQGGAELILNPGVERQDGYFDARQRARAARAYENLALVLCATPSRTLGGAGLAAERLPTASAAYDPLGDAIVSTKGDESLVEVDATVQSVRRRRSETYANFPVVVRTGLYAAGYARHAPVEGSPNSRAGWAAQGETRLAQQARRASDRADRLDRYDVVIGQMDLVSVHDLADRDAVIAGNIRRAIRLTEGMARSPSVKLVVLPEFFMQGVVTGRDLAYWMAVGVRVDGPEMDELKAFAQRCSVFVSGMIYEVDPRWPDRYFNTAFIIDDEGQLIHRYRKIHGADTGLLTLTTPGNIFTDYVAEYGYDALFPVADTKIGKLATLICFDMNFPETARELARRGAEVLIHPTSEPHNARRHGWDVGRRTRAFENLAYVVSAGTGGQYNAKDDVTPSPAKRGHSKIVRFDGRIEVVADGPGHLPVMGPIDLGALREARADARRNLLIWDEPAVYAQAYAAAAERGYPLDAWRDEPMREARQGLALTKAVMQRYFDSGVFTRPAGAPMAEQNMGAMYGAQAEAAR